MENSSKALFIKFLHPWLWRRCPLSIHKQVEIAARIEGLWSSFWHYPGSRDRVKPGRRWKLTFPQGLSKGLPCLDMGLVPHPDSPWLEYCFDIFLMSIAPFAVSASTLASCQTGNYESNERKFTSPSSPLAQERFLVLPLIFLKL